MDEEVNYQALYEKVTGELEQARLAILKMRYARNPLDTLDMKRVSKFIAENYLLIFVAIMVVELVFKLIQINRKTKE